MKEALYYIRDEIPYLQKQKDGTKKSVIGVFPIGAVVVLEKDDMIARGISICAEGDIFSKKVGRELARDRAWKALRWQKSFGKIRRSDIKSIVEPIMSYRLEYNATLTDYEKYLLRDPEIKG